MDRSRRKLFHNCVLTVIPGLQLILSPNLRISEFTKVRIPHSVVKGRMRGTGLSLKFLTHSGQPSHSHTHTLTTQCGNEPLQLMP